MVVMGDSPSGTEWTFELSGGRLALDFVNTQGGMRGVAPKEHLHRYADLVAFGRQAGAVDDRRARRLLAEARRRPADAEAALRDAVTLREALYRIFLARTRDGEPAAGDVELLSAALGRALAHRRVDRRGQSFALGWDASDEALDAPLWPVVESAAEILTSDDALGRVRVCGLFESDECSWLFVDETKSGTRRWCSMKECGNKAKARRHYRRSREDG
jgi:predicted RNA-binding Zn ribbon-like protein